MRNRTAEVSGLLIVDKPSGTSSHGVVAQTRRVLGTRKVGHAGTLDPMATGVLVLGVGRGTRLLGHLALADKSYTATVLLGVETDTDDAEGGMVSSADAAAINAVDDAMIHAALDAQRGDIQQVPSSISAIKIDGKRAYARARAGEQVDLAPRPVRIARLEAVRIRRLPFGIEADLEVDCSTGTYVRAIARDLGRALGIGGHLTSLRRTRVGQFTLDDAAPLDDDAGDRLLALGSAAERCFPIRHVDEAGAEDVRHGRRIPWQGPEQTVAILDAGGDLLALAEPSAGRSRYLAVFA